MPCLLLALFLLFPRVALVLLYFFSHFLEKAYHSRLLILLAGFIFVPLTTLVYAFMINNNIPPEGINLLWLFFAVLIDLGFLGRGYKHQQSRR